jgi:UDP-glucose 4-epimerase
VTGGAGFIGSQLVDRLIEGGIAVTVIDNLSTGSLANIKNVNSRDLLFVKSDLNSEKSLDIVRGSDIVFHLAGNPEVRVGSNDTSVDFNENVVATYKLLEAVRRCRVPNLVFTSTSTVYGEAATIPTPEDYSPMRPISTYGGSKLACEALIAAFSRMFSIRSTVYRFANVTGPPSTHGVVFDFVKKLKLDSARLEILGDGTQCKSYVDIEDCVGGLLFALDRGRTRDQFYDVFNLGSPDAIDVMTIAKIVTKEMRVEPELVLTGGVDGGRGWRGDVKKMHLDISKISNLGWKPKYSSAEAVRRAARAMIDVAATQPIVAARKS